MAARIPKPTSQPKKLLREKLKEIELRLVDLAEFLEVSRPTAYKFIEMYEKGYKDSLEPRLRGFFDFVMNEEGVNKSNAMAYIAQHFLKTKDVASRKEVIGNLLKKEDSIKVEFIDTLTKTQSLDPIIGYLLECQKILARGESVSKDEEAKLAPLSEMYTKLGLRLDIKEKK